MLISFMRDIAKDTTGATAIEYGLIVSLVVIAMIAALNLFADSTIGMWNRVSSEMNTVAGS